MAFQRQRFPNMGEASTAWIRSRSVRSDRTMEATLCRGKLCCSPREITTPSSVAAACSSKLKETQNRFLRARPQARLMRPPNGVCSTSCMPPDSSKKRSATMVVLGGHLSQDGPGPGDIGDQLFGARPIQSTLLRQPVDG